MPKNYFKYFQAPLIRIEYPASVYAGLVHGKAPDGIKTIVTELSDNVISDNLNIQVVTFEKLRYKASILEFDCQQKEAHLNINSNTITRNRFIGKDGSFFYINGGIVSVSNNDFSYNGKLSMEKE